MGHTERDCAVDASAVAAAAAVLAPVVRRTALEDSADLGALLDRMAASPLAIEQVPPGSPLFSFLM